jgi:hypothetical protein
MAKNNSPLNEGAAHRIAWDRDEVKRLEDAEHYDDVAHHMNESRYSGDGKAKYSSHLNMWTTGNQIKKHMSSNLWGEAKREVTDTPVQDDLTGQRSGLNMQTYGGNKGDLERSHRDK